MCCVCVLCVMRGVCLVVCMVCVCVECVMWCVLVVCECCVLGGGGRVCG